MTTKATVGADDIPLSPNAMAEAYYNQAVAERDRRSQEAEKSKQPSKYSAKERRSSTLSDGRPNKRPHVDEEEMKKSNFPYSKEKDAEERLSEIWKPDLSGSNDDKEAALRMTEEALFLELDKLIKAGLKAFHGHESASRELLQTKDLANARGREVQRLQDEEASSRTSMANLLRAMETSKSDARDASRAAQIEARLRSEVSGLRSSHDEAVATATEHKRRVDILENEVRTLKSKLSRITQEKFKLERDSRAAMSLARSMDSHASSDTDFYKRKASELSDRLQASQAKVAEQERRIQEMTRMRERTMSQNRLAQIRAEGSGRGKK